MKEKLISFETAKLAKEKGFNEETYAAYNIKGVLHNNLNKEPYHYDITNKEIDKATNPSYFLLHGFTASTQGLLQKWLREKHNIDVWAQPFISTDVHGAMFLPDKTYSIFIFKNGLWKYDSVDFLNFEGALEKGLQEALKLL